jgi:predicted PurR-regulated permease PerM
MKTKSYYITLLYSILIASLVFFIGLTANWHSLSSAIFSMVLMAYFLWIAIKKFKERKLDVVYDMKRVVAAVALMLLIAAILIFAGTVLQDKPLTQSQKERAIIK